jgi:hypothetical protein
MGIGSGFLVGTLNLAAQNAARLSEMGVVTAFSQYSRSMGATLGSAILGSILLIRLGGDTRTLGGFAGLLELREPLAAGLQWVFAASAIIMALGLLAMVWIREVPMRRGRTSEREDSRQPAADPLQEGSVTASR